MYKRLDDHDEVPSKTTNLHHPTPFSFTLKDFSSPSIPKSTSTASHLVMFCKQKGSLILLSPF